MKNQIAFVLCCIGGFAGYLSGPLVMLDDQKMTEPLPQLQTEPVSTSIPEVEPQPEPEPEPTKPIAVTDPLTGMSATGSTVILISTESCPPCERWWFENSGKLKAAGWRVERIYDQAGLVRQYPAFRIFPARRWFGHDGPMSMQQLREIIRKDAS